VTLNSADENGLKMFDNFKEMTNMDLLNWGKEHGVVWNETEINSFLNEEFDELKSRQMILFLEPFIEEV
jgi:hypothetical protein